MARTHLGNPYRAPPAPLTGGDALNRVMGQYGKMAKSPSVAPMVAVAIRPLSNSPKPERAKAVSGSVKYGGIGPGRLGSAGSARQYDKKPLQEG